MQCRLFEMVRTWRCLQVHVTNDKKLTGQRSEDLPTTTYLGTATLASTYLQAQEQVLNQQE